jgi:hypothetical protein
MLLGIIIMVSRYCTPFQVRLSVEFSTTCQPLPIRLLGRDMRPSQLSIQYLPLDAGHCLFGLSTDGAHWEADGIVNEEHERAAGTRHLFLGPLLPLVELVDRLP